MILLTGATGYVGSRLLSALVARGAPVRCFGRRLDALPAAARAAAVRGDVLDETVLRRAMQGVDTAYYLVHSMTRAVDFAEVDRRGARLFGVVARDAGVRRIVYLGGLGRGADLSAHLASRHEVGNMLRESGVPVVEFRASVIIGAGSISFELARTLVDKLPAMVTPRWVRTPAQPIAIDDVVAYLIEALDIELPRGGIFEIGGADRVSYGGIMREYACQRGLRRWALPIPVLTPHVSSLWLSLVVPRHARVGKLLIDGVRNETTVSDDAAQRVFSVLAMGISEAVRRAVAGLLPEPPALRRARSVLALAACVAACFGAAAIGRLLSLDGVSAWYPAIAKPSWTPPARLFGPVWSALYLMMAVAAWRVWRRDGLREARLSLGVFAIQLVFNAAWSGIFFGLRNPGLAFVEIMALWTLILVTTVLFSARDRVAAVMMLPYLGWVSFASVLNGAIAWMNRPGGNW
jgi:tryptophan-rich sensory protein/uncharacterized protein YbjT (DUF2867 family)